MSILSISSSKPTITEVIDDISVPLKDGFVPSLVLFFCSSKFEPQAVAEQLKATFGDVPQIGCTTAGEISSGQVLKESFVAMLFDKESVEDIWVEVLQGISEGNPVPQAVESLKEAGADIEKLHFKEYLGMILFDGLSCAEEKIMDRLGNYTNLSIVGGSAGDDLKFEKTYVFVNGVAYSDAAVLTIMKPKQGFEIVKTQSFCHVKKSLVATKVDEANRTVEEFDNKPAIEAYAEGLGISVEDAKNRFMSNPLGLIHDGEPYVRSPYRTIDDKMVFFCNIKENMALEILESTDIVKDTQEVVKNIVDQSGKVGGIINFHCILRTLELEQKNQTEAYGNIFKDIPTIGFSTYGEEFIGHINQTSMLVVFK